MALTAQQLEARKLGIGGSDAGTILGVNPYKSAVDLYLEKRGEIEPPDLSDNEAVHFGNVLEDVVADEYTRRVGHKLRRVNAHLQHPELPFMLANLDRKVTGMPWVFEAKTAGQYMSSDWGPSGTDQVPESYLVQVTHYMIVTGYQRAELAVLIGGRDFRHYTIPFDQGLADILVAREAEFWRLVETGTPPAPQSVHDLETLYAIDNGQSLVASDDLIEMVQALSATRAHLKEIEGQKGEMELVIKQALADNSVLLGDDGKPLVTWKKAKDSDRFDAKAFEKDHPDLYRQYLKTQTGSRRFLVK